MAQNETKRSLAEPSKAHHYQPDINPTYQDMATYYGVAIIPTRVRKPQGNAKIEVGGRIVGQAFRRPSQMAFVVPYRMATMFVILHPYDLSSIAKRRGVH